MIANPARRRASAVRALPHPDIMSAIATEPGARDGVPIDLTRFRTKFPRLSKSAFDRAILKLADEKLIHLVAHDHGPALDAKDRERLVHDPKQSDQRGRPSYYVAAQMRNPGIPTVTDRALRYRAQRNAPPGRKLCGYCGSSRSIDIEHINGKEEDTRPENLMYACRSCNTRKGAAFAKWKLGRLTRQFNPTRPARTLRKWIESARDAVLAPTAAAARAAVATIQATAPAVRARFAAQLAAQRRNPDPTFAQYLFAVRAHSPGGHDEGGKIIHATPKAKRSEYARRIAGLKQKRGTNRKAQEVPF